MQGFSGGKIQRELTQDKKDTGEKVEKEGKSIPAAIFFMACHSCPLPLYDAGMVWQQS
ncbi:MAG: hypothetical protein PHP98_08005 [Kiritimatiellae bacterium]|nr:hypothetical protein [Kiritimatiellia bacterium]